MQWNYVVEGNTYWAEHGQVDGKIQSDTPTVCEGKNIGRANETSPEEQAQREAEAKYTKQIDIKGYVEDAEDADTFVFTPMLAHPYQKYGKKLPEAVLSSPKLDGCLTGDSLLQTKEYGLIPLKDVVENEIKCSVKSFNIQTSKVEYKKVLSYFKNRKLDEPVEWFEIELEDGRKLKTTANHKIYIPKLKCWRRIDELEEDDEVMIN